MEEHADSSLQEGLLNEYFAELGSLIGELKQKRAMVESGALIYTEQEKARCHALVLSAQRMLEIVYFEIHYNDSSTRDYQDFQQYTRYKEALFLVKEDFSRLVATPESPERPSGGDGAEEASDTPTKRPDIPPRLSTGRREGVIQHLDQSASLQTQGHYLLQGRRLLEETNQYSQQVLLNLNTQKEQLLGTDAKITSISKSLQDSSLILDKMTKWWHRFV